MHARYLPPCASDATFAEIVRVYKFYLLTYLLTYLQSLTLVVTQLSFHVNAVVQSVGKFEAFNSTRGGAAEAAWAGHTN